MKTSEKKKPVKTIPDGVWESSRPSQKDKRKDNPTVVTDLQGNGYPTNRQSKNNSISS